MPENQVFFIRYLALAIALVSTVVSAAYLPEIWAIPLFVTAGILSAIGLYDVVQTKHSVWHNYPIVGRLRWVFEEFRPEIRQYFIEGDKDALPFSRIQRSLVYARAKNEGSERAFGTLVDTNAIGHEFLAHSITPAPLSDPADFRVSVGGPACRQPYSASILNISAMSFGSMSANAVRALNKGAALGRFFHDTGEGGISPYHREMGGDIVWELGTGYFGCRTADGRFDPVQFAAKAVDPQIKMIEIKLSQGAKPGHGGILPGPKVSAEIAAIRGVPEGEDCISPSTHSAFSTPAGLLQFVQQLRDLSGGKPVGFKLCIGQPWEFMGIVKAMLETDILPDFIVVDGAEGGTGAAPLEFSDHIGMPMREGLHFVHNVLTGANVRQHVRVAASGKIVSAYDIAAAMALGADWVNSARGFMFALGCIQSLACNTNQCPTGVATQDPLRQKALAVPEKSERVYNFHRNTLHALAEMLASAGLHHPNEIGPHHILRRISQTEIRQFAQLHHYLRAGELLDVNATESFYQRNWTLARADSFALQEALPAI